MNLKSLAPLLLSLFTASAFSHSYHDDEEPQPPLKQEAKQEAKTPAPKPKQAHDSAAKQDKTATETPASPAAEPKKAQ